MTVNRKQMALLAFMGAVIARLTYVAVGSFLSIQSVAEMTAEARSQAIMLYVFVPVMGASLVSGLAAAGWFILKDQTANRTAEVIPPKPAPTPPWREDRTDRPETVITLSETDIELSIVLTGDAAKDPEGRKKIGAVMEHYGSGKGAAKIEPVPGPTPATEGGVA